MKKTLVLLAGYPGTGKSYLMRQIQEAYPTFQILSPDAYKEEMWDRYGFDTMEEKEADIQKAWLAYYKDMEDMMQMDISILSDYPFSDKQKSRLEQLAATHAYQIVTIRLVADLDIRDILPAAFTREIYFRAGMSSPVWSVMRNS